MKMNIQIFIPKSGEVQKDVTTLNVNNDHTKKTPKNNIEIKIFINFMYEGEQ